MTLTSMNLPGIETDLGVHFGMMHNSKIVRVVVSRGILRSAAAGSTGRDDSYMATFEAHRKEFEAIASDLFDRGQRGTIRITASDILDFAARRRGRP
jgi:Protein of unknown function (DUF1488)